MNNKEFVDIFFELIGEEIARQEKYGSGFGDDYYPELNEN